MLLSACQHVGKIKDEQPADQSNAKHWQSTPDYFSQSAVALANQAEWQYSGKVGLTTASIKEQASLIWHFVDQSNVIRLFGPLGAGAVKLEFDMFGAHLSDNRGLMHQGSNAQDLLTEIIGWPLPVDALAHWLFAQPLLKQPFTYKLDKNGQVGSIRQLDWQIDYRDYRQYGERSLPRKITATKQFNNPSQGAVTVKLVAKNWQ